MFIINNIFLKAGIRLISPTDSSSDCSNRIVSNTNSIGSNNSRPGANSNRGVVLAGDIHRESASSNRGVPIAITTIILKSLKANSGVRHSITIGHERVGANSGVALTGAVAPESLITISGIPHSATAVIGIEGLLANGGVEISGNIG